jgi:dTDP-4-amino-4,6-dideoxygalactose transaminase
MVGFELRASTVLYKYLRAIGTEKIFILPANVCPVVPLVFLKAGLKFEFCDINENTLCLNETEVLKRLRHDPENYAGILMVRTYGVESDLSTFFGEIKSINNRFLVIDDKCLCVPVFIQEEKNVDLLLFSTGYAKYIDIGYGGYGFISDDDVKYEKVKLSGRNNGRSSIKNNFKKIMQDIIFSYEKKVVYHYEDTDWLDHGEAGNFDQYKKTVLKKTESERSYKEKINDFYFRNLPSEIILPHEFQNWRFNILVPEKENLLNKIFKARLFASSHYLPVAQCFGNYDSPVSKKLYASVINLFNNKKVTIPFASKICIIINDHLNSL